jgi:hypothetical protein
MEDLQSTTRYVTWSLHTKSRSSLKAMLSKVTAPAGAAASGSKGGQHGEGGSAATADFLENTLWNRTLGAMSEEIVAALVCQIFEGEAQRQQGGPPPFAALSTVACCQCNFAESRVVAVACFKTLPH